MVGSFVGDTIGPMDDHVKGKVVIVTGAASGFGRLVAEKVGARGARVVVADIDGEGATVADVAAIHAAGAIAICYVDVGTLEMGRSDYSQFPASVIPTDPTGG